MFRPGLRAGLSPGRHVTWAEYAIVGFLVTGLGLCGFIFWDASHSTVRPDAPKAQLTTYRMAKQVAQLQDRYQLQRAQTVTTSGNGG